MAGMRDYVRDIVMVGSGEEIFEIPNGLRFASIVNNTDNIVELYQAQLAFSAGDRRDALVRVSSFQQQTIPLRQSGNYFTVMYYDGGSVDPKKVSVIFSESNYALNGSLGSPGGSSDVTLKVDEIGLAKQAQFPSALSNGNLKVSVQESLPSGTNNIGSVDVANTVTVQGGVSASITNTPDVNATLVGNPTVKVTGSTGPTVESSANNGMKTASSLVQFGNSSNITVNTTNTTITDADVYVVQADPANTQNVRFGSAASAAAHWLLPGMAMVWQGNLCVTVPSGTATIAVTKYKQ